MNRMPHFLSGRICSYKDTELKSMKVWDICPYLHGTRAYRLLTIKEIQFLLIIKEYKSGHSPSGGCKVNFVNLEGSPARFVGGFKPAAFSVRWIKIQGETGKKQYFTSNIAQNQQSVSAY